MAKETYNPSRKKVPRIFSRLIVFPRVQINLVLHGLIYVLPTVVAVTIITLSMELPISFTTRRYAFIGVSLAFFVLVIYGLVLTNRVVGPLYRLMNHMKEIEKTKKFTPIQFREKDYFSELSDTYNSMLTKVLDAPPEPNP